VAGDTFELPAPEMSAIANTLPAHATEPPLPNATNTNAGNAKTRVASSANASSAQTNMLYGALGDRSATPLASTFARLFAQTASADPAWQSALLGAAGEATVTFTLDVAGYIEHVDVTGSPSQALRSSITRTMALLKSRPFVAKARTTSVHLTATITSGEAADDGLDSSHFGISTHGGNASFVLPIGRRIQLRVK
jgi:type IV secretory pathway TrbL component